MSRAVAYAALVVAGGALALSIHTAVRDRGDAAGTPTGGVCVDADARAELAQLRRVAAIRDARVRVAAAAAGAAGAAAAGGSDGDAVEATAPTVAPGPRRYTRFEIPEPAVTVTQGADGAIEIHTRDPALSGRVLTIHAITDGGERDEMMIRVP